MQLPAWNEALGLPRPWDQQWSLRMQQILAYETDLLEYGDLFDGSHVVEAKTTELLEAARAELQQVLDMGGAVAAVENAYMKQQLVESHTARIRAIESGDLTVVGVNAYQRGRRLSARRRGIGLDPKGRRDRPSASRFESLEAFRKSRSSADVTSALQNLEDAVNNGDNIMPPSIRCR